MLEDLLHLGLVLAVGEVLVQPEGVLAIEDAVLEDGDHRQLVLAMDDVVDEHAGHRRGEPLVRGGAADQVELGLRSEEHTSELQSQSNLVCRLLLEKKKKKTKMNKILKKQRKNINNH